MKSQRPLLVYIAIAYFISWLIFILLALNHHHIIFLFQDDAPHARLQDVVHSIGGLGPISAAIITFRLFHQKGELHQFVSRYSFKKLTLKGWLLAFSPLLIFVFSLLVSRIITHNWFDISGYFEKNKLVKTSNLFAWFLPIVFYGFGEEGGWRGYALPALQSNCAAFKATVILSVIWICWHIPSFFYRYDFKGGAYLGFLLGIFAGAIWLTFLFNYTNGSILAVSLWHLTFNFASMIGKEDIVLSAVMSIAVMLLACFVLIKYKFESLSPVKKSTLHTGIPRSKVLMTTQFPHYKR